MTDQRSGGDRSHALPRAGRLLGPNRFGPVFAARRVESNRWFRIHHAERSGSPEAGPAPAGARLGLTVAKKVAPRATERNRIRRQIRESFRHARPDLPERDYVVRALPPARDIDNARLRRALDELWSRLKTK
ncbi:MAG: ribonuclease P protein component [Wenzhouxiangellaceae bacterium]|nr:ribonuclease P protein component [Wenzhouxiangellaceae bacterium]